METDGGNRCTILQRYLMPLNRTLYFFFEPYTLQWVKKNLNDSGYVYMDTRFTLLYMRNCALQTNHTPN